MRESSNVVTTAPSQGKWVICHLNIYMSAEGRWSGPLRCHLTIRTPWAWIPLDCLRVLPVPEWLLSIHLENGWIGCSKLTLGVKGHWTYMFPWVSTLTTVCPVYYPKAARIGVCGRVVEIGWMDAWMNHWIMSDGSESFYIFTFSLLLTIWFTYWRWTDAYLLVVVMISPWL